MFLHLARKYALPPLEQQTHILIPAESATKGVNSLLDTQKFLEEQATVMAFAGTSFRHYPLSRPLDR